MTEAPSTLRDLVGAYLTEQCTVILDAEPALRGGENVVHVTRVAVRRLRSTIRVFGDLFDVAQAGHLEDELVWWAGLLGAVRDMDILQAGLTEELAALPPELVLGSVASTISTEIAAARKAGMDVVLEAMDTERYRELVALVQTWRSDPPFTAAADAPAMKVKGYVKRAEKKVRKRLAAAVAAREAGEEGADELFHSARKAGKRHRYAVEATLPLWGAKAEKIVAARKDLQDVLGHHQDRAVSVAFLRELGGRLGVRCGVNGFTYGLLYGRIVAAGDRLVDDLRPYL
ncbi:MAG TPA: CHAD domain-containing protein [Propionibacteriaceae bacterium]|jgi:CHAD domain-containing protein|nr:CHAD domain-containing protein [Propionibacteriaceae bacterium]